MGLRHSWSLPDECDPIAFDRAVSDMDRAIKRLAPGAFSAAGAGGGQPYAECNGVAMLYLRSDGVALTDMAAAGEVFRVDRDIGLREMCVRDMRARHVGGRTTPERRGHFKPLGSPANLAACCCLIILKRHLGREITVSSDVPGDGWSRAAALCQEVLGYGGGAAIGGDGMLVLDGDAAEAASAQGAPPS